MQILDVQASMQRRHRTGRESFEQRQMKQLRVKVQHVECAGQAADLVQHVQMGRAVGFERTGIQAQGLFAYRAQLGLGVCVGGGEQDDLVSEIAQSVAETRHDSLGSSVELGRD
jgi:hypothetical protein